MSQGLGGGNGLLFSFRGHGQKVSIALNSDHSGHAFDGGFIYCDRAAVGRLSDTSPVSFR